MKSLLLLYMLMKLSEMTELACTFIIFRETNEVSKMKKLAFSLQKGVPQY